MSLEEVEQGINAIKSEWDNNTPSPSSTLNTDEAAQMGLIHPEEDKEEQQIQPQENLEPQMNQQEEEPQGDSFIDYMNSDREYEKLGFWDSQKDMLKAVGTEFSHVFVPKAWEAQYQARTHYAENMKYLYRYGVGTAAFVFGGEIAAGVKGLGLLGKGINLAGKALTLKPINVVQKGMKAAHAGKSAKAAIMAGKAINGIVEGAVAGALADYNLYRPEENEGQFMDIFGDKEMLAFLQTRENDPEYIQRLKNVGNGLLLNMGVGVGVELGLKPFFSKYLKGLHKSANAKTIEEATEGIAEITEASEGLTNKASVMDMWDKVQALKEQADETGEELDRLILDNFSGDKLSDARRMGEMTIKGEDIYPNADGTFSLKVTKYQDAAKVTPEEYSRQLFEADETGNLAIQHQNQAVKDTWVQRGWLGANDELIKETSNGYKPNTALAKKIVTKYKDKWQIDNNVKIEFVDDLVDKKTGEIIDGQTTKASYLGKNAKEPKKVNQSAVDKKKLQIKKLEDKITMIEGGNKEVSDPLDNLKEQLRIAKEDLGKLETPKQQKIIKDITITINKNTQNPYAVLRNELEHARDYAKGTTPKDADVIGSGTHFSRYTGDNEAEVAPYYTHKKATARANEQETLQNVMDGGQPHEGELKYNYGETIDETRTNTEISNNEYRQEASGNGIYGARPSESNGRIQPYIRRSEDGSSNFGSIIHDPSPEFKVELETEGKPINSYKELAANSDEDAASFISTFRTANEINGKLSAQVYEYSAEEYKQMRLFTAENSKSGFALKPDGDIVSVFSTEKGSLKGLMNLAIQNGGKKLDCFDTFLPKIYKKFGFVEVGRVKWNEEYKPKNWDKDFFKQYNNGEPDVVYMGLAQPKPIEPQQLKLDFNTPETLIKSADDITNGLTSGDIKLTSTKDVDLLVTKYQELDPEISGYTFKDVANDADGYYNRLMADGNTESAQAFANSLNTGDANLINQIVRKQIATAKLTGFLKDQLNKCPEEQFDNIMTNLKALAEHSKEYNQAIKTSLGRGLRYQDLNKRAIEAFGESGLSKAEKDGIFQIADLATKIWRETQNFTLMKPKETKAHFWKAFEEQNADAFNNIFKDEPMRKLINKILDDAIKKKDFSPQKMYQEIMRALTDENTQRAAWMVKLTDCTDNVLKVANEWSKNTASYMINNVLGFKSLCNNLIGAGRMMTFPMNKILGGMLTGQDYITREGIRTYQNMLINFGESMRLAKQAFINGDGLLTNTKTFMDDVLEKGFNEWSLSFKNLDETKVSLQNIHSFFPRMMMASDEFLSQLQYRSIMRAKAAEIVDGGIEVGKINPINRSAAIDAKFKEMAFNEDGLPLDFKTYAEAKDILFQLPLNRQLFNPLTGEKQAVDTQTNLLKVGGQFQNITERNPILKLFFPFIKTPTNIAQAALDTNPLYMALSPDFKAKFNSSDPLIRAKARGHLALCGMMHFAAFTMAGMGMITGSEPFDKKEKTALLRTGWKPYSFRLPNGSYMSYKNFVPFDAMLASCADFVAISGRVMDKDLNKGATDIILRSVASMMNNYIDQAGFRTNSEKMLDILNPSLDMSKRETVLASFISGYVPMGSVVRDVQKVLSPEQTKAQTFYERCFKNLAPQIVKADYVRDVFGRQVNSYQAFLTSFTDDDYNMPEYQEMQRLAELGWTPSQLKAVVEGTRVNFHEFKNINTGRSASDALGEELSQIKLNGMTLREAVRALSQDPEYQNLPDGINDGDYDWSNSPYETKLKKIQDVFHEYYNEAKNSVIDNYGQFFKNSKGETMDMLQGRIDLEMEKKTTAQQLIDTFK